MPFEHLNHPKIQSILTSVGLGAMGQLVMLIHNHLKTNKKVDFRVWFFSLIMAGWVGWLLSTLLPEDGKFTYSAISIGGMVCYQLIDFINDVGLEYIKKHIFRLKK